MSRELTVVPETHYRHPLSESAREHRETVASAWRKLAGGSGSREADNLFLDFFYDATLNYTSDMCWEFIGAAGLGKKTFDAVYLEGVCSPLEAWRVKRMMKHTEKSRDNYYRRYVRKWISDGADVRHTENVVWYNLHRLYYTPSKKDDTDEWLMRWRDYCIARNIANTLEDGEKAVLIVGGAHDTEKHLKKLAPSIALNATFREVYRSYKEACKVKTEAPAKA